MTFSFLLFKMETVIKSTSGVLGLNQYSFGDGSSVLPDTAAGQCGMFAL